MAQLQALNLPKAPLKLSSKAGRIYIHCLLRKTGCPHSRGMG